MSGASQRMRRGFDRDSQELIFGAQFMIHRRHVDGVWQQCSPADEGYEPDSGVHRYDRVVGFSISDEELALLNRNPAVAEAERRSRSSNKQTSHCQTVERWSIFERYLLSYHPDEEYTAFVKLCRARSDKDADQLEGDERLTMRGPPALLVLAYTQHLRKEDPAQAEPDRKWATIRAYAQNALTSVLQEFSVPAPYATKDSRVIRQLDEYKVDGEDSAHAFDVAEAMPKLWTTLWAIRGWGMIKRLRAWAMLLISLVIMARASCVTKHCPVVETMELPSERHWDPDGLPKYIIITLLNWKSRKKANVNKPYPLKIHRNYLDQRFCPVFWLLIYLKYAGHTTGPLFQVNGQAIPEKVWTGMTNHWFVQAGLRTPGRPANRDTGQPRMKPKGCSNHSIRRSAAQWAGRCGAREMDVRNAGRWRSMAILAKYMAQGAVQREAYEDDEEGAQEDPIFSMFVFKKVTSAGIGGLDIM